MYNFSTDFAEITDDRGNLLRKYTGNEFGVSDTNTFINPTIDEDYDWVVRFAEFEIMKAMLKEKEDMNNKNYYDNFMMESFKIRPNYEITDVKILAPNKVVEVTFADGTKEKAVCHETDTFDLETAISVCISKKIMGGTSAYNKAIRRGLKVYEDKLKKIEKEAAELERIANKKAKRKAYKERRDTKRDEVERELLIEIQKEAYLRAMRELESGK